MHTRICLLGTPRCGSQYISQLLIGTLCKIYNLPSIINLKEPFTMNQNEALRLNSRRQMIHSTSTNKNFHITNKIDSLLDIYRLSNQAQPAVMKIFPYYYLIPSFEKIIKTLKDAGFIFIIIRRNNIEEQLLSYAVAGINQQWTLPLDAPKFTDSIEIKDLNSLLEMYANLKIFDHLLKSCGLTDLPIINYETAETDILTIFEDVNTDYVEVQQQRLEDPYQNIKNKDEVQEYIKKLIS